MNYKEKVESYSKDYNSIVSRVSDIVTFADENYESRKFDHPLSSMWYYDISGFSQAENGDGILVIFIEHQDPFGEFSPSIEQIFVSYEMLDAFDDEELKTCLKEDAYRIELEETLRLKSDLERKLNIHIREYDNILNRLKDLQNEN